MAANIPAGLKAADISRFAIRAAQVEKVKPVIAYWCNYWIVNQILSKGLHAKNSESMTYTTDLMDKLEQTKAENPGNDAMIDDAAGQAYVEQFGLETFQRADNAIQANKVTRQTADTFQAAATFLDLTHIWANSDPEIAAKSKYAKFHALRIARALKAGEDPNLSNPAPPPPPPQEVPLDPNDLEVQLLDSPSVQPHDHNAPRQPSVEDIPDECDGPLADDPPPEEPPPPARRESSNLVPTPPNETANPTVYYYNKQAADEQVSPLEPSPTYRDASGGGYFPHVPTFTSEEGPPSLPTAPPDDQGMSYGGAPALPPPSTSYLGPQPSVDMPDAPQPPSVPAPQQPQQKPQQQPQQQSPFTPVAAPPTAPSVPGPQIYAPPQPPTAPPQTYRRPPQPPQPPQAPAPHRQPAPPAVQAPSGGGAEYAADEEAILAAQKHARWAISALNFEDVKTAVQELRGALAVLGAR
ncbi:MAG: hypothetical protein M1832_001743 [Thelocarpon impressellum]|nr:MAG: hypothetical protein M1832_001743 [Thelocarpon impressellum]